jgi:hypothetical protein
MNDHDQRLKKEVRRGFVFLRRVARESVANYIFFQKDWRDLKRKRNKLKADASPFSTFRIKKLNFEIDFIREDLRDTDEELAELGQHLMALCDAADRVMSFREKAHLLGVSEQHLRKQVNGWEDKRIFTMIFACHAEYRGNKDFVDCNLLEAPFWGIASAWFFQLLKTNKEFSSKCSEGVDKFFSHLPKYQQVTGHDGTVTLKRMPPKLELVSREEN